MPTPGRREALALSRGAIRCRRKFLRIFPKGFHDPTYLDWERGYKGGRAPANTTERAVCSRYAVAVRGTSPPTARAMSAARSVFSQWKSGSGLPKWPYAAVFL